jgi:hypothetical protein
VLDLVNSEAAAVWDEIEAKVAEQQWPSAPCRINPHHLTTARKRLGPDGDGLVIEDHSPSKGGHLVTTLQPADQEGRLNQITVAARHKRALQTRYVSWTQGNQGERARIGVAGEHLFHASLLASAPSGLMPIRPMGGEVRTLFDDEIRGGPLDSAAWLTVPGESGRPQNYLLMIEVKNLRSWIYPSAEELYQVLDKAARLSAEDPDLPIIPLLVCRRSHLQAGKMAKQLGFVILDTEVQPIIWPEEEDPRLLDEVREGLAYDLLSIPPNREDAPALDRVVGGLSRALPLIAERTADVWHATGRHLGEHYSAIRRAANAAGRLDLLESLRDNAAQLGVAGGW